MRALISKLVTREVRGLHEAAYLLAAFSFGSQLLALVRDRMLAGSFGAGTELDLYYAAFRVPDLLFALVASFVSVYVLVPFLEEQKDSPQRLRSFMASVFTVFTGIMVLCAGVAFVCADYLAAALYPGFDDTTQPTLVLLMRIMLVQPVLLGVSNLCAALVQVRQRFVLYALSPLFYNLGIILGIVVCVPLWGIAGLAWGVVLGALFHVLIQLPVVYTDRAAPSLTFRPDVRALVRVVRISLPRTLTLSSQQLVLLVLAALASLAGAGGIAAFNLAYNLQAVPLTIVGVSYSVAAFPTLVRLYTNGDHNRFFDTVTTTVRHILFWSLPGMALLIVLRAHLVRIVLGSGAFDWNDTRLTAALLALFALSLAAQALVLLFVRGSYAMGNTRTPLLVNMGTSALTIVLAVFFVEVLKQEDVHAWFVALLRVSDVTSTGVLGLALAYSVGSWCTVFGLLASLPDGFKRMVPTFLGTLLRGVVASLAGGVAAFLTLQVTAPYFNVTTFVGIALHGALAGSAGVVVWGSSVYALGGEELVEILRAGRARFWKSTIRAAE